MSNTSLLFEPFKSRSLSLSNRIVMAPMTRSFSPDATPTDDVVEYYRKRAVGGTGLIITEGTAPEYEAANDDGRVPVFYGEKPLSGWKKVVDAVHDAGAKIMPQLWHMGMLRRQDKSPHKDIASVGPSGTNKAGGKKISEPMTLTQIEDAIQGFAKSAGYAQELGFDGVEIHGAHGYLIDQFFWDGTNLRADEFGGSMVDRTKFAADIVKAVRAVVGPSFPILLRFSQWKQQDYAVKLAPSPQELEAFLTPLSDAGVDIFHCSTRRFWEPEFDGSELNLAGWTKKMTGKPTITVGSVGLDQDFISGYGSPDAVAAPASLDNLIERLEREEFDLVAVGRALITNPEWANHVRNDTFDKLKPYDTKSLANLV